MEPSAHRLAMASELLRPHPLPETRFGWKLGGTLAPAPRRLRYLATGERAVLEVRHHGVVLMRPALETVAVIVGAAVIGSLVSPDDGGDLVDTVAGFVATYFVLRLLWKTLYW